MRNFLIVALTLFLSGSGTGLAQNPLGPPPIPSTLEKVADNFVEITKTLDKVLAQDFDVVVPGHGPVAKHADIVKWRAEIEKLQKRLTSMVREGKTKDEVTKMLIDEFGWDPKGRATTNSVDSMMSQVKR